MSDARPLPRHPVYVISKGRHETPLTARFLLADRVPFAIVVEPPERELYEAAMLREATAIATERGESVDEYMARVRVLVLPFANLGLGGIPARNWVWDHARDSGAERHWILDDNIRWIERRVDRLRLKCDAGAAFAVIEQFIARYENIAVAGINYSNFVPDNVDVPPIYTNTKVYSCLCIDNALPVRWRGRYNEDTDLCLQVLGRGLCTLLVSAFCIMKVGTMRMKGGNSDTLYASFGRTRMSRELERRHPHVVETRRKFGRAQHHVVGQWRCFNTPLKLKPGIDLASMPRVDEHGLRIVALQPPEHPDTKRLLDEYGA